MKRVDFVNHVIIDSLKLDKRLKDMFILKFVRLVRTRGAKDASDKFKTCRELIMRYLADEERHSNIDQYYAEYPFQKNIWMVRLFQCSDRQPHQVLDLLKIYTGFQEPLVTVEEAADAQHEYLASRKGTVRTNLPMTLRAYMASMIHAYECWERLDTLEKDVVKTLCSRFADRPDQYDPFIYPSKPKGVSDWKQYWLYWYKWIRVVLIFKNYQDRTEGSRFIPISDVYKDYDLEKHYSESFDEDSAVMRSFWGYNFVNSPERQRQQEIFGDLVISQIDEEMKTTDWFSDPSILGYAGKIHHIPKKGTIKRRSIAVPNRFFQAALVPLYAFLQEVQAVLPQDCTFNQNKPVRKITERLSAKEYVGSVDLSQATDNLPYLWFKETFGILFERFRDPEDNVNKSLEFFESMLKDDWFNGDHLSEWTVGQPLGTLPSFGILSLTHNLICESIAYELRDFTSPYYVLGDDVVLFSRQVRERYIQIMNEANIPLSLHKSYEERLVEFAGRVFIRNQIPWYTSDHAIVTWPSLFDYQRSTGVRIPFRNLPKSLRRRWIRSFEDEHEAILAYDVASYAVAPCDLRRTDQFDRALEIFFRYLYDTEENTVTDSSNVFTYVHDSSGEPVLVSKSNHHVAPSTWFKTKYRPASTDKILSCAKLACSESLTA